MAEGKGLLDFISSPAGQGLLAAGFGALAGRGTRAQAIGQGGLAGLLAYGQAQGNQADMARQKTQDAWMQTQRDWMSQDRARQEADRAKREAFMSDALAPKPMMQQSAAPDPQNDYTNPDFLFQAGKSATTPIPGMGSIPMGVRPVDPMAALRSGFGVEEAMQLEKLTKPRAPNLQTFKPGETVRNMDTGEIVYQAPEKADLPSSVREYDFARSQGFKGSYQDWVMSQKRASAPSFAVNMADPTAVAKAAMSFQNDYRAATKASYARATAYNAMLEAANNPSPKGDMTLVYSFIKALDPESVVREGEIGLVESNRAIPDRIKGYAQKLATGQSLLPKERQDLLEQGRTLSFTDYKRSRNDIKAYRDNAARLGLDPQLYAPDPYEGVDFGPRRLGGGPQNKPSQAPAQPQVAPDVQSLVDKYRSR